jgi:hypothetical protein
MNSTRRSHRHLPESELSSGSSVKYLGITFDRKLIWNEHINNIANKTAELSEPYSCLGYQSILSFVIKL